MSTERCVCSAVVQGDLREGGRGHGDGPELPGGEDERVRLGGARPVQRGPGQRLLRRKCTDPHALIWEGPTTTSCRGEEYLGSV